MTIAGIDHLAITVDDLERSTAFYRDVLGARILTDHAIGERIAVRLLAIGKGAAINLHVTGHGHWLVADRPTPGSADACFRWIGTIGGTAAHLAAKGVRVIEGPVARIAADGQAGQSIYFRDPDGNLLELLSTVAP